MTLESLPAIEAPPTASAQRMARVDRVAIEELGVTLEALMESAARAVARVARLMLGGVAGRRIVALAGRGSNGGDALAAARLLYGWGADARAVIVHDPERLRPETRRQHDLLGRLGVRVTRYRPDGEDPLAGAELLLDGLLGYSVSGPPRDELGELIRQANRSRVPILAIDLPSGLDPDTGEPLGVTIRAACTVTLALPKIGLLAPAAAALVGELVLVDIGIPPAAHERADLDVALLFAKSDMVRVLR